MTWGYIGAAIANGVRPTLAKESAMTNILTDTTSRFAPLFAWREQCADVLRLLDETRTIYPMRLRVNTIVNGLIRDTTEPSLTYAVRAFYTGSRTTALEVPEQLQPILRAYHEELTERQELQLVTEYVELQEAEAARQEAVAAAARKQQQSAAMATATQTVAELEAGPAAGVMTSEDWESLARIADDEEARGVAGMKELALKCYLRAALIRHQGRHLS